MTTTVSDEANKSIRTQNQNAPVETPAPNHQSLTGLTLRQQSYSLLKDWLTNSINNPDVSNRRKRRWKRMGWEVFERKALLLAAAKDLEENGIKNGLKLAAADIFVEKAQRALTGRGWMLYGFGVVTAIAVVALLGWAAWHVYGADVAQILHVSKSSETVSRAYLTVLILKTTTAGGFVVGVAYFLVSLSRALLHEATVLFSRRHSLRFGRLFVYLKSEEMTRQDLEAVFNWNAEFSTAFKDIQPDQVTKSPLVRLIEQPGEAAKYIADALKPTIEKFGQEIRKKAGASGA